MLPGVNNVRSGLGLPPLGALDDLFRRPPLLLYLTAEPFEYARSDWPKSVVMVGPCAWDPPEEPPEWFREMTQPVVLVTTSSEFQDDGQLIQTAFDALADEPMMVLATLPAGDPASFHVPANARLERFIPHSAALDHAVCAITHGGMGATQKALARGIPVCVVPFGRDQLEVARRVEVADVGTRLPAGHLRPDRLLAKVREAMTKTDGAKRMEERFAAAGGPIAAADAFESRLLLSKPSAL
jgi:MGT family glycosyltransferase